jgi:hypothetical protein
MNLYTENSSENVSVPVAMRSCEKVEACVCVLWLGGDLDDGPQSLALPVRHAHDGGAPRVSLDETEHPTSTELVGLQRAALVLAHRHAVPFVELNWVDTIKHNGVLREVALHALVEHVVLRGSRLVRHTQNLARLCRRGVREVRQVW